MYKMDQFDMEEEDYDPDKRYFSVEQRKAQFEKKIFWLLLLVMLLAWIFIFQDVLIEHGQENWGWGMTAADVPVEKTSGRRGKY